MPNLDEMIDGTRSAPAPVAPAPVAPAPVAPVSAKEKAARVCSEDDLREVGHWIYEKACTFGVGAKIRKEIIELVESPDPWGWIDDNGNALKDKCQKLGFTFWDKPLEGLELLGAAVEAFSGAASWGSIDDARRYVEAFS